MAKGKYHEWITPEGLLKIGGWAKDGLFDEQIAAKMGIQRPTLYEWKNRFPDIADALKRNKEYVDREVENSLLKNALGYEYDEVTKERVEDPETGEIKMMVTKVVTKHVTPNTTAQIFFLKNRKPDQWRDKREHEHSGPNGGPIHTQTDQVMDLSKLSDKELKQLEELSRKTTDTITD